jgi:hypothetical protein
VCFFKLDYCYDKREREELSNRADYPLIKVVCEKRLVEEKEELRKEL